MKFSKVIFSIALLFCATNLFAAELLPNVSVTVKDSLTLEPIEFATVVLLTPNDSILISGITNEKGFISLPSEAANCKIRISFIGYKDYQAPVTARDLGVILMVHDATQLSEVSVTAATRIAKIDRDVYVITKEMRAGTSTSRELMGKLKGVVYNYYDQSIMINGSKDVLILIDGIEKDQQMASTLSPDRIDRIEVIKEPVGKYAADGYKAVVNIITKKDFSGFDITASFNSMFNFIDRHGNPSPFLQAFANLNIIYTYKKLNLYAAYRNNYSKIYLPEASQTRYGDLEVITPPMNYKEPNLIGLYNYNNISLGGDYLLKPGNTIALEVNYNTSFNDRTTVYDLTTMLNNIVTGESKSKTFSHSKINALQTTLTYLGKWSDRSNFEADFRYRYSTPSNKSTFEQGEMYSESKNNQVENFYRLNFAYTYQFTPKFSMDLGYGVMTGRFNLYQNDTVLTQQQVRNRPSAYLSYAFSQKLSIKAGAMVEFFSQKFMNINQSQIGFLPFANIMYKPSDKFSIIAKYQSYPSYPDINQLTIFETQMDSLTFSLGNPYLKPSNYQVVSLDINFLKYFTVQPFLDFDFSNNQQYIYQQDGKYYQKTVNTNYTKLGANINFTLPITKTPFWQNWLQVAEFWLSYNDVRNKEFSLMVNSMFIYNVPKWDAMAVLGIQKNITKWGMLQGYSTNGNDISMIMLQKSFFQKRLDCAIMYVIPIPEGFIKYEQNNMTQIPDTYYSFNRFGLGTLKNLINIQINFHFNQGKQVNIKKSSLEDDSVIKLKKGIL
jgi:hypothetical protein